MDVVSVYNDFMFEMNKENGYFSETEFNGISRRAELKFIDWISGKLDGSIPQPYTTQKVRDWLSFLITSVNLQPVNGKVTRPANYYSYENVSLIGDYFKNPTCDEDAEDENINVPVVNGNNVSIELLSGDEYYNKCNTYIAEDKPSFTKPITKMIGTTFEFSPIDIGSVRLEYIRKPVFGELKMKLDTTYNEMVPDPAASINYEWEEYAREYLIFFLLDIASNSTREAALKNMNAASKP